MPTPNKGVLVGGIVIISVGFINAALHHKPETKVFAGGVGIVLIASLVEMFGSNAAKLANAFMGLAVVTVLLVEGTDIVQVLNKSQGKPATKTGTPAKTPKK